MQIIKSKNGFFLTIATILLILPLIFLISYYTGISETGREDAMGKMRCDELHYFVEDVKEDMKRSVTIFGRRAAIYALDYIVETGNSLKDYTFTCTPQCDVDCNEFSFDNTGSEAAIAELTLCGTLFGENATYMMNNTIPEFTRRIEEHALEMHFVTNLSVAEIKVVPMDAWHFALIVDYKIRAYDKEGMCYYTENIIRAMSSTSIIGLEDPLYILQTEGHVMKYIDNCSASLGALGVAGCSVKDWGNGTGSGLVVFWSYLKDNLSKPERQSYCTDLGEEANNQIVVMDTAFGECNNLDACCFDINCPYHLGGVIDYAKNNPGGSFVGKCNVSIPWISATCKMDNETGFGPGPGCKRPPGCNETFIGTGDCIFILNLENELGCKMHRVLKGYKSNETNTSCYYVSDIEENYNSECLLVNHSNGPCFFDRLDGNLNLSQNYVDQSMEYFDNSLIGIETLVNLYELKEYNAMYPSIEIYSNATWIDYLYWQDTLGCGVIFSCEAMGERLKLDCPHGYKHETDTTCSNVSQCECPDGVCTENEFCPADAFTCNDSICYEPTCINGCGEDPITDDIDPGECDETTFGACAGGMGCYCDAISNCVPCLVTDAACTFDEQCCSPPGKCAGWKCK